MIAYTAQIDYKNGKYSIQFETNNYEYYKLVEKACQKAINKKDKTVLKGRCSQMKNAWAFVKDWWVSKWQ